MKRTIVLLSAVIASAPSVTFAHCPLCVVATGGLALIASQLGLSSAIVGIVTGAFALAMGLWFARLVKRTFVPYQSVLVTLFVYLTTVVPIMPLAREYRPLYVPFVGAYGTTYTLDLFLIGALVGAVVILVAPRISRYVTRVSGRHIPYQQLITIGVLLTLISALVEMIIR